MKEIDLQIIISSYCTNSKVHHLLRHGCKTDTHSHARLNSFGGIWKRECRDPNIPLSFQEHRLKRKCTLWKVLSISKLRYWYMPWINRPGSQPPFKSDNRGMCWMVIFYWRGRVRVGGAAELCNIWDQKGHLISGRNKRWPNGALSRAAM